MRPRAGFSLLEFLIALFLLLVIVGGGVFLLGTTSRTWFHGEAVVHTHTGARNLAAFLERLFAGAFLAGDWEGARPEFVGDAAAVSFCALVSPVAGRTDFARVRVFFDPDEETLYVIKQRADEPYRDYDLPDRRGAQPLLTAVRRLRFSYLRDGVFIADWDSRPAAGQAGLLPEAVRLEVELYGPRRRAGRRPSEEFHALFTIRTAR